MYSYQATAETPSTSVWACHQSCGDYTHWTIVKEDISKIPKGSIPNSWPQATTTNFALEEAREIVRRATETDRPNPDNEKGEVVEQIRTGLCGICLMDRPLKTEDLCAKCFEGSDRPLVY